MIAAMVLAVVGFATVSPTDAARLAVDGSPDVAAATARAEQTAATLAASRDTLFPSLSSSYAQTPQGNPPGPTIISRLVTVGLQTNVADFLAYGTTVRQNVLLLESSRDDLAVATRGERIKTIGLYFDALKARTIAVARDRAVTLARAQRSAADVRFRAGDVPRLDVLRADIAVSQAIASAESAHAADDNATDALSVETALPATTFATTTDVAALAPGAASAAATTSPPAPATSAPPADPVAAALASRAEIASAGASANAAEAARRVVAGTAFPGLSVTAGYTAGTDSDVPIGAPSIAAQVTIPLGPGLHERVRLENARVAEARAKVAVARRAVRLEVAASARTLEALRRAATAATSARIGADAELTATDLGYRNGGSTSLDVSNARQTDVQATVDELGAVYDLAKAEATLRLQTGR